MCELETGKILCPTNILSIEVFFRSRKAALCTSLSDAPGTDYSSSFDTFREKERSCLFDLRRGGGFLLGYAYPSERYVANDCALY